MLTFRAGTSPSVPAVLMSACVPFAIRVNICFAHPLGLVCMIYDLLVHCVRTVAVRERTGSNDVASEEGLLKLPATCPRRGFSEFSPVHNMYSRVLLRSIEDTRTIPSLLLKRPHPVCRQQLSEQNHPLALCNSRELHATKALCRGQPEGCAYTDPTVGVRASGGCHKQEEVVSFPA